jgi:hypothetical protein
VAVDSRAGRSFPYHPNIHSIPGYRIFRLDLPVACRQRRRLGNFGGGG